VQASFSLRFCLAGIIQFDHAPSLTLLSAGDLRPMKDRIETPFDSIENAQQYIRLLGEAVAQTKRDIDDEIIRATQQTSHPRVKVLRVVDYNLEKLQRHLLVSGRTLTDLRSLRHLMHEERTATKGTDRYQVAKTA
jgi:hypothetical protein